MPITEKIVKIKSKTVNIRLFSGTMLEIVITVTRFYYIFNLINI